MAGRRPTSTRNAQVPEPPAAADERDTARTGELGSEGGSPGGLVQAMAEPEPGFEASAGEPGARTGLGLPLLVALGIPIALIVLWFVTSMRGC